MNNGLTSSPAVLTVLIVLRTSSLEGEENL